MMNLACRVGLIALLGMMFGAAASRGQEEPARPPESEAVRVPISRDAWVSAVGREADANLGGANRLKLKSIQEMSLIDIDPAPFRGRVILGATLHLRRAAEPRLWRLTVEQSRVRLGRRHLTDLCPPGRRAPLPPCRHPDVPWAQPGSDLTSVILGHGGTTWRMADAFAPDADGWQRVAVDPSSSPRGSPGSATASSSSTTPARSGPATASTFDLTLFPNRFVFSRESGRDKPPYLTVSLGPEDRDAARRSRRDPRRTGHGRPARRRGLRLLDHARRRGPAGTLGFFVEVDGQDRSPLPDPDGRRAGGRVSMHLRDLDLEPGAEVVADGPGRRWGGQRRPGDREPTSAVSDRVAEAAARRRPEPFAGRGPAARSSADGRGRRHRRAGQGPARRPAR